MFINFARFYLNLKFTRILVLFQTPVSPLLSQL